MGLCEDFKKEEILKSKTQGEAVRLVASINTSGSYSLRANNVNLCLCLLKGDCYEVIALLNHLNFSH